MTKRPLRILAVEDNPHDFAQIRRAFQASDFVAQFTHYLRAEQAIERLESTDAVFDVMITDYNLPGLSGLDLCKRLLAQNVPFPLLMLTGTGSEMTAVEAIKAGVSDYLIKDFDGGFVALLPDKVEAIMRQYAEQQKMRHMTVQVERLSNAVNQSTCGIIIANLEGYIEYANPKLIEITDFSTSDIAGKSLSFLTSKDESDHSGSMHDAVMAGSDWQGEIQIERDDGENFWLHVSVSPNKNKDGAVINSLLILEDVTEIRRINAQLALQADIERYQHVFDASPNALLMTSEQGEAVLVNQRMQCMFGYPQEKVVGSTIEGLFSEDFRATYDELRQRYFGNPGKVTPESGLDTYGLRADGSLFSVNVNLNVVRAGAEPMLLTTITDVTLRKQAEEALFEEKERLRLTLESIGDAVITTDAHGTVDYINPIAEKLTGYSLTEAVNQPLDRIFPIFDEKDRKPCANPVRQCLRQGKVVGLGNRTILINRYSEEYSIQDSAAPIKSIDDRILGVIMVFSDVTEERRLADQIAFQASHDALTELVNRREFDARLQRVLNNTKAEGITHALCYLDLDQFKVVNDTCGHVAGDELLRQIAVVLRQHIRMRDTLARLGGDEFGILIEHCSIAQANRIAESLRLAVGQYRFVWEDHIFNIGVSVGVVAIADSDESTRELLIKADSACYTAKRDGRNRIHVYEADATESNVHRGEMKWVSRITNALENNQFCLFYQPIRSLNDVCRFHCELLLRMTDSNDEIVAPGAFMPAAERYSLTTKIDCWVIEKAFSWLKTHPKDLANLYQCAINLSGFSLGSREVLAEIIKQLDDRTVSPEKICFEITETAAITNLRYASHFIDQLRSYGCQFALDDFGSGLSSFGYLKNLPVDYLKIDGGFVKNIVNNPTDRAMVKSINEIGHVMGKKTIAEFAENDGIIECLKKIGVDFAQGYGVGRPKPIETIEFASL